MKKQVKNMTQDERNRYVANRIIKILTDAGYDYDGMLRVIELARHKFNKLQKA